MTQWVEGTIYDNIDKFANSLGYENASIAIPLAMIPWQSTEDRDSFIRAVAGTDPVTSLGKANYFSNLHQKGGSN